MTINNLPKYVNEYKYVVYRIVDSEAWYYGCYNDEAKAREVAIMIDGCIKFN